MIKIAEVGAEEEADRNRSLDVQQEVGKVRNRESLVRLRRGRDQLVEGVRELVVVKANDFIPVFSPERGGRARAKEKAEI